MNPNPNLTDASDPVILSGPVKTDAAPVVRSSADGTLAVSPSLLSRLLSWKNNPARWGEALLVNRDGSPRRYRWYQEQDLECRADRIVHLDGRAVGKTVNLATLLLWFCHVNRWKSVLVAAPYQAQLDLIVEEAEFQIHNVPILNEAVAREKSGGLKIKRKTHVDIFFRNGCTAHFRPAGTRGDAFRGLHVDLILVDEGAWLPEAAWTALMPCLNPGGAMRVYSTPSGLRDRAYYQISGPEAQRKGWTVFRWPAWIAPDWSAKRREDLLVFYGGEGTAGWRHEVAGEHGQPSYGAFSAALVMKAVSEIEGYQKAVLRGEDFVGCANEQESRQRMEALLNLSGGRGRCWMGVDTGYTSDPTEVVVLEEDENEVLSLFLRVHAERLPYPLVSELIALVDTVYNPVGIGLDRGGNGAAVEQELTGLDKFSERGMAAKLVAYDFGGTLVVGEDANGNEIRKRTKEEMSRLISKALSANKLRLPAQDPEVEDQLCSQTYVRTERGVVYSKGSDHVNDALRTALLRRAQEIDPQYEPVFINLPFVHFQPVKFPWER